MATISELYHVEHWQYRAEGNANMVLQYIGPDPRFKTTILRLRKTDRPDEHKLGSESNNHVTQEKKDVSQESLFASKVIGLLLGKEFVEQLIAVSLSPKFLSSLSDAIEPSRPQNRLQKGIDCSQVVGFLALDHTRFIKPSTTQPSVAVEIKPKWGFLTRSAFISKDQGIKRRKCRFCMYQHRKMKSGQEESLSEYCPIDLFSGEELLVQDALDSLVQTPQNNLRLFVNGVQQTISTGTMVQCLSGGFSRSVATPPTLQDAFQSSEAGGDETRTSLIDVLAQILIQSPLLKRLGRLQQALDSLDIETIHRFYEQLKQSATDTTVPTDTLPQPTFDEFLSTAETFLYRTDMDEMMDRDQETFVTNNAASLGFGPEDDLQDPEVVPETLKMHYLREFLLSATLKDCSILITVRREDEELVHADQIEERMIAEQDAANRTASAETGAPEFRENCHRIRVKEEEFVYKITCIDLDPKRMSSVPMYLKKDRDIVNYYLEAVGDREPNCGLR